MLILQWSPKEGWTAKCFLIDKLNDNIQEEWHYRAPSRGDLGQMRAVLNVGCTMEGKQYHIINNDN